MKYFFYSRKNGFPGGNPIKVFWMGGWECSGEFVDLSGKEIMNHPEAPKWLKEISSRYLNWYFYPEKQEITDIRTIN